MSDAERLDAPNQQVVRPDGSAPWDEGTGGSTAEPKRKDTKKDDDTKGTKKDDDAKKAKKG